MKPTLVLILSFGLLSSITPAMADISVDYGSYNSLKRQWDRNRKNVIKYSQEKNASNTDNAKDYAIHPDPAFHDTDESQMDATTDSSVVVSKPLPVKELATSNKTISTTTANKTTASKETSNKGTANKATANKTASKKATTNKTAANKALNNTKHTTR